MQLWALDSGLCMGSIFLHTNVSAIVTEYSQSIQSQNHFCYRLTCIFWSYPSSGHQYGMLSHRAVCCCRDSYRRCLVYRDDHKREAQTSTQNSSLPSSCWPFSVSFLVSILFSIIFVKVEVEMNWLNMNWIFSVYIVLNRFDSSGNFLITGASDSHMFVLDARPSKRFEVIGWIGTF